MHRLTICFEQPSDPDAFDRHYTGVHTDIARRVPGLVGYRYSKPRPLGGAAPYLVAELDFADADALSAALRSAELAEADTDAAGLGAARTVFTAEIVTVA